MQQIEIALNEIDINKQAALCDCIINHFFFIIMEQYSFVEMHCLFAACTLCGGDHVYANLTEQN